MPVSKRSFNPPSKDSTTGSREHMLQHLGSAPELAGEARLGPLLSPATPNCNWEKGPKQ